MPGICQFIMTTQQLIVITQLLVTATQQLLIITQLLVTTTQQLIIITQLSVTTTQLLISKPTNFNPFLVCPGSEI